MQEPDLCMTKQEFLSFCLKKFGVQPDYPFDGDTETAVLRHGDNRKWFAILLRVSLCRFGFDSDTAADVVNLKLPAEMFGSFGKDDGVFPAYHMNKLHWVSVLLPEAPDSIVELLADASYETTRSRRRTRK
ncbi:MAG: MmcQ/YjbR family DNA-binding protein [Firmicutes bacterium]|nr:MmcQ/YjbR family DNA-binding protein [Bacillota bacterium]